MQSVVFVALDRWRSLFNMKDQKAIAPPFITIYLYLIWQLQPDCIVSICTSLYGHIKVASAATDE